MITLLKAIPNANFILPYRLLLCCFDDDDVNANNSIIKWQSVTRIDGKKQHVKFYCLVLFESKVLRKINLTISSSILKVKLVKYLTNLYLIIFKSIAAII